jgi:putative addiction module component (TIGR02574 family)
MTASDLEAAVLKLPPKERARIAEKLLASLDTLSEAERDEIWAGEALRRDADLDENPGLARDNDSVFRDARARVR